MRTRVELYSVLRETAGIQELTVEIPDGASVATLLGAVFARHPALRDWEGRLLLAADLSYVDRSHVIRPGEVISVMPPVQGG